MDQPELHYNLRLFPLQCPVLLRMVSDYQTDISTTNMIKGSSQRLLALVLFSDGLDAVVAAAEATSLTDGDGMLLAPQEMLVQYRDSGQAKTEKRSLFKP